jgi:hypothetical protein
MVVPNPRATRGVIRDYLTDSDDAFITDSDGARLIVDWRYQSPRFPEGLSAAELRLASEEDQRQTVLFWFFSNVEFYTAGPGPPFGFNGTLNTQAFGEVTMGGLDTGTWFSPPSLVQVGPTIAEEFGGVVSPKLLDDIAANSPGDWVWLDPEPGFEEQGTASRADVFTRIDRLEALLGKLSTVVPEHGGIGHNEPPSPIIPEALGAFERARTELATGDDAGPQAAVEILAPIELKARLSLVDMFEIFKEAYAKALGEEAGKQTAKLPAMLVRLGLWSAFCSGLAELLKLLVRIH